MPIETFEYKDDDDKEAIQQTMKLDGLRTITDYGKNRLKYRYWIGTIFRKDHESEESWKWGWLTDALAEKDSTVGWACGQVEKCPSTGKLHLQVLVALKEPGRVTAIQGVRKASWVAVSKTPHFAAYYCLKPATRVEGDNNRFIQGDPQLDPRIRKPSRAVTSGNGGVGRGTRTDLHRVIGKIMEGQDLKNTIATSTDVGEVATFVNNYRGLQLYADIKDDHDRSKGLLPGGDARDNKPITVILYYGSPGTGKSWRARSEIEYIREKMGYTNTYYQPSFEGDTIWFGQYNKHKILLLEDIPHLGSISEWKKMLDIYYGVKLKRKLMEPVDGVYEWIWITTNHTIETLLRSTKGVTPTMMEAETKACLRRFDVYEVMDTPSQFTGQVDEKVLDRLISLHKEKKKTTVSQYSLVHVPRQKSNMTEFERKTQWLMSSSSSTNDTKHSRMSSGTESEALLPHPYLSQERNVSDVKLIQTDGSKELEASSLIKTGREMIRKLEEEKKKMMTVTSTFVYSPSLPRTDWKTIRDRLRLDPPIGTYARLSSERIKKEKEEEEVKKLTIAEKRKRSRVDKDSDRLERKKKIKTQSQKEEELLLRRQREERELDARVGVSVVENCNGGLSNTDPIIINDSSTIIELD